MNIPVLYARIPKYIKTFIGGVLSYIFYPVVFFKDERAIDFYYRYTIFSYVGHIFVTLLIAFVIKMIKKTEMKFSYIKTAIYVRVISSVLAGILFGSDLIILFIILAFGIGTVYFSAKNYFEHKDNDKDCADKQNSI